MCFFGTERLQTGWDRNLRQHTCQLKVILGCFRFLGIMNRTAMNMAEQVSVDVKSCRSMSRNGVTGSFGRFILSFLRILHIDFHSVYTSLQSPKITNTEFFWEGVQLFF